MKIRQVSVDQVIPYPGNPRKNVDAVGAVAASIQEFGFQQPIVVDADQVVIVGHTRLLAAQQLGLEQVPVLVADGLTPAQVRAYRLADNRTGENAEWDNDLLAAELAALDGDIDLALTGFTEAELGVLRNLQEDQAGKTGDDDAPPVPVLAVSKPGDLWLLGGHRVLCGDATSREDLEALLAGDLCDACWTDPPYNVDYSGADGAKIKNDKLVDDKFRALLDASFTGIMAALKPGGACYVAHADTEGLNFRGAFLGAGLKLSGCLVWVKNALVLGRSDYQWRHEPILYGWKPGAAHRWFGGRRNTTVLEAEQDLPFSLDRDVLQIDIGETTLVIRGTDLEVEEVLPSVVRVEKPRRNPDHPTMKPVSLVLQQLKNSTTTGDVVLDPFGGSGSTLIACQKSSRFARLIELDERYCDVIVRRWQDFTGQTATRESDGVTFDSLQPESAAA